VKALVEQCERLSLSPRVGFYLFTYQASNLLGQQGADGRGRLAAMIFTF